MEQKRIDRITTVVNHRQHGIIVVFEDIHDPHNAAAIMRTCDAMGIQNAWFIFEKEEAYNPKKVGKATSSSANKWLDFTIFRSTKDCIKELKKQHYAIIISALTDQSVSLRDYEFNEEKIALFVGNEHRGVSDEALHNADVVLKIPMLGFVQSLNVSVATAILLWDITQKKKQTSLTQIEKKKLTDSFIKRA